MGTTLHQIFVQEIREADKQAWADMRFDLWDRLSVEEHFVATYNILTRERQFGYIALTGDDQPVGFAEISIRDYVNGST